MKLSGAMWHALLAALMLVGCDNSSSGVDNPLLLPEPALSYFMQGKLDQGRAKILLESGLNVNALDEYGQALLHVAVWNGDIEGVKFLLERGAIVDTPLLPDQITSLRLAADQGYTEIAELLIKNGADVSKQDIKMYTPIHRAAVQGHKGVVELLLAHNAVVDCRESKLCTPLYFAVANGHKEVVELLLAHKADPAVQDKSGYSPLHETAVDNSVEIAELLLERGANVDAKNNAGETPLHWAARTERSRTVQKDGKDTEETMENVEIVELFLKHHADINAQDTLGRTPLDMADFYVHDKVGAILRQNGGKTRMELQQSAADK